MNILHTVKELLERVEALEQKVSPKCTCSKCTGLPDIEGYYADDELLDPETGTLIVDSPAPEFKPPVPAPTPYDYDRLYWGTGGSNENPHLVRIESHSRHCAKHHTLSATSKAILQEHLKFLRDNGREMSDVERLLATLPNEEQS